MQKYLVIELKNSECKKYLWDSISFYVENDVLVVFEIETETNEMVLRVPMENVLYYERVIENGE